jgi:hypothetical protein
MKFMFIGQLLHQCVPRQHVHVFELDAMMDGMLRNTLGDFFKHIKVVASVSLKNRCKVYLEGNVRGEKYTVALKRTSLNRHWHVI